MSIEDARHNAMAAAYQYRKPAWIVIDMLQRGLRVFLGAHEEYLQAEVQRYHPLEIVYPDGARESAIEDEE